MPATRKFNTSPTAGPILLIAGGRDFTLQHEHRAWLDGLHAGLCFRLVVTGGAPGADTGGFLWARSRDLPTHVMPADWDKHGKAAGPLRNAAMARYLADRAHPSNRVVLFPGGRGTSNMHAQADLLDIPTIVWRCFQEPPPR
jgi:hypothetical protein